MEVEPQSQLRVELAGRGGQWRYIDGMRDQVYDYSIPSYDYLDVFATMSSARACSTASHCVLASRT